jgi:hypothetical protein
VIEDGEKKMPWPKRYLGDAVYVEHDGFGLVLTTEDGYNVTNRIVLEPEVWSALESYIKTHAEAAQAVDPLEQKEDSHDDP